MDFTYFLSVLYGMYSFGDLDLAVAVLKAALNSPVSVGHTNSLEPTLCSQ